MPQPPLRRGVPALVIVAVIVAVAVAVAVTVAVITGAVRVPFRTRIRTRFRARIRGRLRGRLRVRIRVRMRMRVDLHMAYGGTSTPLQLLPSYTLRPGARPMQLGLPRPCAPVRTDGPAPVVR
ncbi:hypothetical protein GCM10010495_29020 [Kitasatospora herbaricolor]|nr:hypothetical protein GCM10010495_29020 [Kitasatospora herbaricolor]